MANGIPLAQMYGEVSSFQFAVMLRLFFSIETWLGYMELIGSEIL